MTEPSSRVPSQYEQMRAGMRAHRAAATPSPRAALRWGVTGTLTCAGWLLVDIAAREGPRALLGLSPFRYLALAGTAVVAGALAAAGALVLRKLRRRGLPL